MVQRLACNAASLPQEVIAEIVERTDGVPLFRRRNFPPRSPTRGASPSVSNLHQLDGHDRRASAERPLIIGANCYAGRGLRAAMGTSGKTSLARLSAARRRN